MSASWLKLKIRLSQMSKKKKVLIITAFLIVFLVFITLWRNIPPKMSDTNLELWIADKVSQEDTEPLFFKPGLFGGKMFYGSKYKPDYDENGMATEPDEFVLYTISSFPDALLGSAHVTEIKITDPSVTVFGLTLDSSPTDVKKALKKHGFRYRKGSNGNQPDYVRGKYTILFYEHNFIIISVKTTNIARIQY